LTLRVGIGAGVLSGLLLALSAPSFGVGWLAWIALVPAAAITLTAPQSRAGRLAMPVAYAVYLELLLVPALPFGLAEGQFADVPVPVMVGDSPVLVVALVAVPLAGGLLYALRFGHAPVGWRPAGLWLVLVPALSWTALDLVRVKLDPGGLWGPLFLSQHDLPTASASALAGPLLLTLAIVAFNYTLALGAVRLRVEGASPPARASAAAALFLAAAVAGVMVALDSEEGGRRLTVAAVQPGYDLADEERPEVRYHRPGTYHLSALDTIEDLGILTRQAARRGARVVVWPEASLYVDPHEEPAVRRALALQAARSGATLVVPYFARTRRQAAAVTVSPEGSISAGHPKQRPMWFLGEDGGNKSAPEPLATANGAVGTLLGVDNQDPGLGRLLSVRGADLLASSTHDWRQLAEQQRAFARVQAAASRVPVVRADWRYGSAVYDTDGEPVADAGTALRRTAVVGEVRIAGPGTGYREVGDVVGWFALAATALLLVSFVPGMIRR
jgi:apolipoprotein N-acyltransferase